VAHRRSFKPPAGRDTVRWRWEVGLPLIVVGVLMAWAVAGVHGGQAFFWVGVVMAAIGATIFFSGRINR
jgi:hypothetical protein